LKKKKTWREIREKEARRREDKICSKKESRKKLMVVKGRKGGCEGKGKRGRKFVRLFC